MNNKKFTELKTWEQVQIVAYGLIWAVITLMGTGFIPF